MANSGIIKEKKKSSDKENYIGSINEQEESLSSEEPQREEWPSLDCLQDNRLQDSLPKKRARVAVDKLGSKCYVRLPVVESSGTINPLLLYPSNKDFSIEKALFVEPPEPEKTVEEYYLDLCNEMNEAPCRLFLKGLRKAEINLSYYSVSKMSFRAIAMTLEKNPTVKSIIFTDNFLNLDGCYHLGKMLVENSNLEHINFTGCRMGPEGMHKFVVNLPLNKTLRKVNFAGNMIGDEGVRYLSDAIAGGSKISDIDLSNNSLTSQSLVYLLEALDVNNKLYRLNFSWNKITVPNHLEILAKILAESTIFGEIDLSWNNMNDRFIKAITNLLDIPNLKVLILKHNGFKDDIIEAIAEKLPLCKALETLDLSFNPLSAADAKVLLKCMSNPNVTLQKLLLDNIIVDNQFLSIKNKVLSSVFRQNAVITHGNYKIAENKTDFRDIVLKRAHFVCSTAKKNSCNIGSIILALNNLREGQPISEKEVPSEFKSLGAVPVDDDLFEAFVKAFPGPGRGQLGKTCNISAMADYVERLWPGTEIQPAKDKKKNK